MVMPQNNGQQAILAQHALVMLGFILPGGEVLGTWFGMKVGANESPDVRKVLRKNWAFQTTGFLLRIVLILATLAWIAADISTNNQNLTSHNVAAEKSEHTEVELNLPGEPGLESNSSFHTSFSDVQAIFPWGNHALSFIVAVITSVFLWFATMFLSLINLALVALSKPGFYPLILPWLLKEKAS